MSTRFVRELGVASVDEKHTDRCGIAICTTGQGSDTPLLKELQKARASAARISAEKADRSIRKVLKSFAELEREIKMVEALALKEENTSNEGEQDDNDDDDDDDDDDDTADD